MDPIKIVQIFETHLDAMDFEIFLDIMEELKNNRIGICKSKQQVVNLIQTYPALLTLFYEYLASRGEHY